MKEREGERNAGTGRLEERKGGQVAALSDRDNRKQPAALLSAMITRLLQVYSHASA